MHCCGRHNLTDIHVTHITASKVIKVSYVVASTTITTFKDNDRKQAEDTQGAMLVTVYMKKATTLSG